MSTSLLGDTADTTSTGLAQRLGMYPRRALQQHWMGSSLFPGTTRPGTLEGKHPHTEREAQTFVCWVFFKEGLSVPVSLTTVSASMFPRGSTSCLGCCPGWWVTR